MSHHCPSCQRVLYSRRLKHCGFCGAEIPESLRFTPEEIAAQDEKMAQLDQQRKKREQDAADEEAARRRNLGDDGIDLTPFM